MNTSLSPAQIPIVAHRDGAALVVAAPGAGKTHVLAHRAAALIDSGVMSSSILLTTFTRKARQEMQARIIGLCGDVGKCVNVMTFHGLANRQLLFSGEKFSILSESECLDILRAQRKARGMTKDDPDAGDFLKVISRAANTDKPVSEIAAMLNLDAALYAGMAEEYAATKRDLLACDYDDVLIRYRDKLRTDDTFRERQQNRFAYIMVDEYQDTNPIQSQIMRLLADDRQNVMAVGDDFQSIYTFRGADISNILTFTTLFPRAVRYDLTENFRSRAPIIAAANRLISHATEKIEKTLTTTRGDGHPLHIKVCQDETMEASYIIRQVQAWQGRGIPLHDIAILYRSSFHAMLVEMNVTRAGLPYRKYGGHKLTETKHIRDIISNMWILLNPSHRIAWQRVLSRLPGVGATTAMNVSGVLAASGDVLTAMPNIRLPKAACEAWRYLQQWYRYAEFETAQECIAWAWAWYEQTQQWEKNRSENSEELEEFRNDGIQAVYDFAVDFETPQAFLNEFVLDDPTKNEDGAAKDVLTLGTIHSAKGLEWPYVIVMRLNDGMLPSYRAESMEEERRIFYVSITRAREQAIVTTLRTQRQGDKISGALPSPFLDEIQ